MQMRICYFGTYEEDYPRNALLITGLRERGLTVIECHESIWQGLIDKSHAYHGITALKLIFRIFIAYLRLIIRYLRLPQHDLVIVGYVGQFDMLLAWVLTRSRGIPIVFNAMISIYDTFCEDRGLISPQSFAGRGLWWAENLSCRAADLVLVETQGYINYYVQTFFLPPKKFRAIPLAADNTLFKPQTKIQANNQLCQVLFVGKFIPLHGCEVIVEAATLLRDQPIHFTFVGAGQDYNHVLNLVKERNLTNLTLTGWVEPPLLPNYFAQADICLGVFSASAKAGRVVTNKVYQGLAMRKPVLTADTPALRAELAAGEEVWVCRPTNAADLALQITTLANDPKLRETIAQKGYEAFQQRYSPRAIAEKVHICLLELVPAAKMNDSTT